ncbi:MAG TPA: hypothetical protein VF129_04765 [Actinomycetota bacterium]
MSSGGGARPAGHVTLADAAPNGLATMLAGLLESNLARHPRRSRLLRSGLVEIEATDAGVVATVRMAPGRVEIAGGRADPGADLSVHASSGDLLDLAAAPLWAGLPAPSSRDGRNVLGRLATGRVRVRGLIRHPVVLSRFARLLSVR